MFKTRTSFEPYKWHSIRVFQSSHIMETIQVDFTSFTFREAMSKPTGSGTTELFQNDLEPVSEANTSSAHLTDLEHHSDVCEWTVSG